MNHATNHPESNSQLPQPAERRSRATRFKVGMGIGILTGAIIGACASDSATGHAQDTTADGGGTHAATDGATGHGGASGSAEAGASYGCTVPLTNASDVEFIDMMVPHHEMAIMMAEQELARGNSAAVKTFAQRVKDAQMMEIAQLKAARKELTGSDVVPPPPPDPHMDMDMAMMMTMSGAALDMMFIDDMIPHHAGVLEVTHRAKDTLQRADIKALATKMFDDQAREIGELAALRAM
jgi:uncharacterized protein (DUF305 family)